MSQIRLFAGSLLKLQCHELLQGLRTGYRTITAAHSQLTTPIRHLAWRATNSVPLAQNNTAASPNEGKGQEVRVKLETKKESRVLAREASGEFFDL